MRRFWTFILFSAMCITACNNSHRSPEWACGWSVSPDRTVNDAGVAGHFNANKDRWKAAFDFLKSTDLERIQAGRYPIQGDSVFAIVSEYQPKPIEGCRFETHRRYIDLQYVISGKEKMGVAPAKFASPLTDYDGDNDIQFFTCPDDKTVYSEAGPESFFIFMPDDAHRPSIRPGEEGWVKKVVIKILY
ncbi:MAG: YhcH/YjgK/YiaL family protein [Candidatus Cryptobacteroides sp.]